MTTIEAEPSTTSASEPLDHREALLFQSAALETDAWIGLQLRGSEALNQLFELELYVALDADVPLDGATVTQVMQAPVAIAFGREPDLESPWYGVLRELELVSVVPSRRVVYRAVVVPSAWYLTQTVRSRVFQELAVPDIVAQVLEEAGFARGRGFELALRGSYPVREYVAQYQESDFEFVARLLEHEGMFFFFDHASGSDTLVIADHNGAFRSSSVSPVRFALHADSRVHPDTLFALRQVHRAIPAHVVLRDANWRTPGVPLQADAVVDRNGFGVVSLYGDHFKTESDGTRLAKIRAQERAIATHVHYAQGCAPSLRPGQTFTLEGHPHGDLDREYFVSAVEHTFVGEHAGALPREDDDALDVATELELVPADVPFRPPRLTRRPRIYGLIHARIDGEVEGAPAPCDDQGRYRVLFPFDELGAIGGRASRWIRAAQVFAGPGYGMHFPLHIGTEVLVSHVDGDPDRPLIVGAVPNPSTSSPVVRDNATQSVVRTKGNIVEEYEDDAR